MRFFSLTRPLLAPVLALLLTGCQSAGYVQQVATDGDGISCDKIHQAFQAYQADRQSARALTELARLIHPESTGIADQAMADSGQYFQQIRTTTDITLAVRGCPPL